MEIFTSGDVKSPTNTVGAAIVPYVLLWPPQEFVAEGVFKKQSWLVSHRAMNLTTHTGPRYHGVKLSIS